MQSNKTRRIYVRHGNKEYMNGDADIYKHDPGITEYGMKKCKIVAKKLIENWGYPSRIISSPYRRCRETAMVLNSCLEKPFEEIFIDVDLSEYLGNHKNVPIDVTQETKIYRPPHPETFEDMIQRVKKHNDRARRRANELDNGVIWYITHGLIIKQLAHMIGIRLNKQFPCLTCFSILEEEDMIKSEQLLFPDEQKQKKENSWLGHGSHIKKILKRSESIDKILQRGVLQTI